MPIVVNMMMMMMVFQRRLEDGLSANAYHTGWTPRGVVLIANDIWVEVI